MAKDIKYKNGEPVPEKDPILTRAIKNADLPTLRRILQALCEDSEICCAEVRKRMLVSRKREVIEILDDDNVDDHDIAPELRSEKKRRVMKDDEDFKLVSRYEMCGTCKKSYDITENGDEACRTHSEALEIDPGFFPDDDDLEDDPSSIDPYTDERFEEWPEGFRWPCCDEPTHGKPCVIQRHAPKDYGEYAFLLDENIPT
ncbi:hypothetical protein F5Y16DRAFT_425252 [Xylariaceae sp. FL0255]|nr:hypothetical protein F5Y16DRAFT_425252 [Xylariaceae sp. FL0255]